MATGSRATSPTGQPTQRTSAQLTTYGGIAVLVGVAASVQARINGELATRLGNSTQAAAISFGVGLLLLSLLILLVPTMRAGLRRIPAALRTGELARWQLLGGFGGAGFVAVQTFSVPLVGVALFTVAGVAGQTVSSLFVDRAGLGPGGRRRITVSRVAAAGIALVAVLISVSDKLGGATFSVVAILGGVAAGTAIAVQGAINARVAVAARSPLSASFVSFAVGTTFLLVLLTVLTAAGGSAISTDVQPWWLYTGGAIGLVFIATGAFLISHMGVLLFGLCQIAGQVLGAIALDLFAPVPGETVTTATFVGAALTLVAVVIGAGLLRRTRPPRRS